MRKKLLPILAVLLLCSALTGCGTKETSDSPQISPASQTGTIDPAKNWEPKLEIERLNGTGAMIIFQQDTISTDTMVLCGNDYFLQVFTDDGWEDLPRKQETVFWVTDAFVVSAVPRDDVDWEWLYGTLGSGHYRIGKGVALVQDGEITQRSTVYAEFTLKAPDETPAADVTEASESVYDAGANLPKNTYSYTYPELTSSTHYTYQQALRSNVVILDRGSAVENQQVFQEFVEAAAAGQAATVRCTQLGEDYGFPQVYDISYDGLHYTIHWFENGTEKRFSFKNMVCYREDPDNLTTVRYLLVMDRDTTWEDIQWGMVCGDDTQAVAHIVVYQELRYIPDYPPIPEDGTVALTQWGKTLFSTTDQQTEKLHDLFANAQYTPQKQDAYYNGLDLVFTGKDGSQVTLWLSYYGDCFLYNGSFYRYDTQKLFSILGISGWPDAVVQAHS